MAEDTKPNKASKAPETPKKDATEATAPDPRQAGLDRLAAAKEVPVKRAPARFTRRSDRQLAEAIKRAASRDKV